MRQMIDWKNWGLMRILRVLLGTAGIVSAITQADLVFGLLSGLILLTGIFNVGCCGAYGCSTGTCRTTRNTNLQPNPIKSHEEIS